MGKICFFNSNLAWGGGENWHLNAAVAMAGRGKKVILACHPRGALFEKAPRDLPGLEVVPYAIGKLSFLNPLTRLKLSGFFKKENVSTLLMNLPADLKAAGPAAKSAGVPNIILRRGSALPVRNSIINRYLYGQVLTRLIVNSEATRRMVFINNEKLIPEERVFLLQNGIDIARFDEMLMQSGTALCPGTTDASNSRLTASKSSPTPILLQGVEDKSLQGISGVKCPEEGSEEREKPFVLGNAGRLNKQKGQHLFLQLGALLKKQKLNFRLIIAGTGEREAELKELSERLGLTGQVVFTGFLEDMSPFWNEIDAFVLTSLWEGFGYVLLEAMLAEKPVLAFGVSNIPELIRSGENGLLFPLPKEEAQESLHNGGPGGEAEWQKEKEPVQAMARAVLNLAKNSELGKSMGKNGREFAVRDYSQDACMDKLEKILE